MTEGAGARMHDFQVRASLEDKLVQCFCLPQMWCEIRCFVPCAHYRLAIDSGEVASCWQLMKQILILFKHLYLRP